MDVNLNVPSETMKQLFCWMFIICLFSGNTALAGSLLSGIARTTDRDTIQVYLSFDKFPAYSVTAKEKRIDVSLDRTQPSSSLKYFETDDRIVKILPIINDNRMVVSLFLRHKPQNIKTEELEGSKLLISIQAGNASMSSNSIVSKQNSDIKAPAVAPSDSSSPLRSTPYAGNWPRFFSDYESPVTYSVPVRYSLPPFPIINLLPPGDVRQDTLPQEILELGRLNAWAEMRTILLELLKAEQQPDKQKLLALSLGEALLRGDAAEDAARQLSHVVQSFPTDPVGLYARFLLALLKSRTDVGYAAGPELSEIRQSLGPESPLKPWFSMYGIENAIAAGWYEKAQKLIEQPETVFSPNMQNLVEMRRAEIYAGLNLPLKAYAAFMLLKDRPMISTCPHASKSYCDTLYFHRKYKETGECYTGLIPMVEDKEASGLISFRKAMAELHLQPDKPPLEQLALIEEAFPFTEAAYRAEMKRTDLKYQADPTWGDDAARIYEGLAEKSVKRPLVAEARFKKALVEHLMGRNEEALHLLMQFLREDRSGELRPTAQALLIQILPQEIDRLVKSDRFPDALVLAKQNREIFQKNWIDIAVLADLAYSYSQVGLYEHAKDVYQYVMDVVDTARREPFYLPLLKAVSAREDAALAASLAERYLNTYPAGKDRGEILRIHLEALLDEGKYAEAKALLPDPLPEDATIVSLAAALAFQQREFAKTLELIERIDKEDSKMPPEIRFFKAESMFQTGSKDDAGAIFRTLQKEGPHSEQVLYRLAQIELANGRTEEALKFFRQIVEKGKNSLWQRYAEKEIEYLESTERLRKKME